MSDQVKEHKLQGRQIVYVPKLNRPKMAALNEGVELITDEEKEAKRNAIKAQNKKLQAANRKAAQTASKGGRK